MQAFSQKANYSDGIIFMIFHIIAYSYCLDLSGRAKPASVCKISEKLQAFEFFKSELHKKTARPANKYQTGATPRRLFFLDFHCRFLADQQGAVLSWRAPADTHRGALKQAAEDEHRETMCGATPCTLHPEWKS